MTALSTFRHAAWLVCLAVVLLFTGCASEPLVMRFDANGGEGRVWPPPQTQEVPRYRYVGQLTGEGNFKPPNEQRAGWRQALHWIVGLIEGEARPVVLQRPQSGVVDARNRVLVTDVSRAAVFVFDEAAGRLDVWEYAAAGQRFVAPIGIAIGHNGEVLVADAELARVFRLDPEGKPLGEIGAGVLTRPTGLARDPAQGRIFVADTHAHDIKVFDEQGRLIDRWGQRGEEEGHLNFPGYLVWSDNALYVTDMLNARVQAFDARGDPKMQFGTRGLYVGNFVRPKGIAADDEGNIYVVESMHDTLLVFDNEARLLLSIGGTGSEVGKFYLPAGVWIDSHNRVFVADMFNGRVVVFQFLGGG